MARPPPRGPAPHSADTELRQLLRVRRILDGAEQEFVVAHGKAAAAKHEFRAGDQVEGKGVPVADTRLETADLYKVSGLEVVARGPEVVAAPPPYLAVPPSLEVYRARGHRRLAAQTFTKRCATCVWACEMAVEMIVDQWNPARKRYRLLRAEELPALRGRSDAQGPGPPGHVVGGGGLGRRGGDGPSGAGRVICGGRPAT